MAVLPCGSWQGWQWLVMGGGSVERSFFYSRLEHSFFFRSQVC